jgi:hypothetical protein
MKTLRGLSLALLLLFALCACAQEAVTVLLDDGPAAATPSGPTALTNTQKFSFFVRNTADPGNLLGAALEAGLSQRSHDNLGFGQGARGFGGRYGAALADRATFNAFSQFLIPSVLHQDPRFVPLRHGGFKLRIRHAIGSAIVTKTDTGGGAFNASVVLGSFASGALSNAYYPAGERGTVFTIRSSALNFGGVIGARLAREFWPDIKRNLLRRKTQR